MKTGTVALFGGALVCAGLGSARAQEFDWAGAAYSGSNFSYADALDYSDLDPFDYDIHLGAGAFSTSISNDYGASSAEGTATSFRAEASSTGRAYGLGVTFNYHYFRVTQDATLALEWDLTAYDFGFSSSIAILEVGVGTIFHTGTNTSGTGSVSLQAGVDYLLDCPVGAGTLPGGGPASNYALITIPAPAGVGLLAISAGGAIRRRR
ncbi:MAG: hypothetical protein H6811_09240 [Phycisphaeraceae bacterium]|nr:hypothetical protein [Phycisphaeraceae bacterium]